MPRAMFVLLACLLAGSAAASAPRARDLGIPFDGTPGPLNAITDVAGVTVGQVTLIEDLADGRKVRTGVTARPSWARACRACMSSTGPCAR